MTIGEFKAWLEEFRKNVVDDTPTPEQVRQICKKIHALEQ